MLANRPRIKCFVLMPFHERFTFVYEYGIRAALVGLRDSYAEEIDLDIHRADEVLSTHKSKMQEIVESIKSHDLIVVDISDNNPNVLWELGFCQAQGKHIILIGQNTEDLPFNIRGLDVLRYSFSVSGLDELKSDFTRKLAGLFKDVLDHRSSLRFDGEISSNLAAIEDGLTTIPANSILRKMASNEIARLLGRISALTTGRFDLRNEKPNQEIIRYYCDYLLQLDGNDCSFDTVTFHGFWSQITDNGMVWDFLNANINAAMLGVHVRRVFVVNEEIQDDASGQLQDRLLRRLESSTKGAAGNMEIRLLKTKSFEEDFAANGRNFGLLKKGDQKLLFLPQYAHERGPMTHTDFFYARTGELLTRNIEENLEKIHSHERLFGRIWSQTAVTGVG